MVKDVYIIFKTHLDIGFVDFGRNVIKKYLESFIPNAIKRGYELKDTDTPYVWTVGSWLINEALKYDHDGLVRKAICDGIITWHALPFTPFSETMSKELFDYCLSISKKLDKEFGKKTIAAKVSDVPGQTKAIIKPFAEYGVEFLHIGVNVAHPLPDVPALFRWVNNGDEIITLYQQSYGSSFEYGDFAIEFGFTGDNQGPLTTNGIVNIYKELREKYQGAYIRAATLNDVAYKLREIRNRLPIVTNEIGDTWIQNAGTDPKKVSLYREMLRYIEKNGINADISDNLLLVPEHTWGGDTKVFFPNFCDYTVEDLFRIKDDPHKINFEKTWEEKREYIDRAQQVMGTNFEYDATAPDLSKFLEIPIPDLEFEISWQLFDSQDYRRFSRVGLNRDVAQDCWVVMDNMKYNLPEYKGGIHVAKAQKAYKSSNALWIVLCFDNIVKVEHGLPDIYVKIENGYMEIIWVGARDNRLPQAYWLKFNKYSDQNWQISKLGQWIDADDIIGNPLLSATDKGVRNQEVLIESLDAILVAPYGRRLLDYEKCPKEQNLYFNLYNNVWGCNHPMWYSDDSRFRFVIKELYHA